MIVLGQFECAESKKIGLLIFPTGEHAGKWHINGVKWRKIARIVSQLLKVLET